MTLLSFVLASPASKPPTGFDKTLVVARDLIDAIGFVADNNEWPEKLKDKKFYKKGQVKIWEPGDLADLGAFTRKGKGWLKNAAEEVWLDELTSEYSRPQEEFRRILEMKKEKRCPPAITIEDEFGDGRGRIMVQHAFGEKIPALNYELTPEGKVLIPNEENDDTPF